MQFFCLEKRQSNQIIHTTVFTNQIDSTSLFKDTTDGCRSEIWWKRKSIQHTQQPAMSSSVSSSDLACSNVSEDSLLKRDLDNGEVEREKKVKHHIWCITADQRSCIVGLNDLENGLRDSLRNLQHKGKGTTWTVMNEAMSSRVESSFVGTIQPSSNQGAYDGCNLLQLN